MAQDRGRKGKSSGRKRPQALEDTLQVRVRKKNPMIERMATPNGPDRNTLLAEPSPILGSRAPSDQAPGVAVPEPMYSAAEESETTQEVDLEESLHRDVRSHQDPDGASPRAHREVYARASELLDDDATEIASAPPSQRPRARARPEELPVPRPPVRLDDPGASRTPQKPPTPAVQSGEGLVQGEARSKQSRVEGKVRAQAPRDGARPDVVPRELLGKWGTDAVGAAAQQANIARIEQSLPTVRAPQLKTLRAELTQAEISSLESALAGEMDVRGMEPGLSPKRSLEHLVNEPSFAELGAQERARILKAIARDPRDIATVKSAIALLKTGTAKRLRAIERERLFAIYLALGSETRALLAQLAARPLRGRSAIEDRDFRDGSLILHLHTIAVSGELAPSLERSGLKRTKVLGWVMGSLANPERLPFEEGPDGILGMLEFGLADSSPGELARIWMCLITGAMSCPLAGGGIIDLAEPIRSQKAAPFSSRETPLRVAFDRMIALAARDHGSDRRALLAEGGKSVNAEIIARALEILYGVPFSVAAGAATAQRQLERLPADPQRTPPAFLSLLYERGERMFVFDRLDGGDVRVRAPHGRSTKKKGLERVDPHRIVESPESGVDRIPADEFVTCAGAAWIPRG